MPQTSLLSAYCWMKHKLQTVSNFTVGQTSNWLEPRFFHQNQTSNLCWTRNGLNRPKSGKPFWTTTGLSTKTELRYKKTPSNPPKNPKTPNPQTEFDSTLILGAQVVSQHSLGSMNRKWNLTWQHKTLLGIWKICTLVSLWNGQHQCSFFIVQRSTLCIQK